jgi:arginase family enzyme
VQEPIGLAKRRLRLSFQEAMACLEVFVSSPQFAGLTIAEINPDHADEQGTLASIFIESLVRVFAARKS